MDRDSARAVQITHYEGCWRSHRDCAVAMVEKARAERDRLASELADARRAMREVADNLNERVEFSEINPVDKARMALWAGKLKEAAGDG